MSIPLSPLSERALRLALALVATIALGALAACGDDEEDTGAKPQSLSIEMSEPGAGKYKFTVPQSVKGGLVEISFKNNGKVPHEAQLIRVDGDQTVQDVVKVFSNEEPAPIPPWFRAAGGVGATKPGASGTATQELTPGRYFLVDTETPEGAEKNYAEQGAVVEFEVTEGEGGGELPAAQAKVSAREYRFTTSGLKAGQNTIEFSNEGKELHHLIAFPYNPGATLDDVKKFAAAEGPGGGPPPGPPPINFEQGESTAVLDGGQRQVTRLTLKSGKYALLCFIPDRKGGPPHVAKGMLQEVTIP